MLYSVEPSKNANIFANSANFLNSLNREISWHCTFNSYFIKQSTLRWTLSTLNALLLTNVSPLSHFLYLKKCKSKFAYKERYILQTKHCSDPLIITTLLFQKQIEMFLQYSYILFHFSYLKLLQISNNIVPGRLFYM